MDILLLAMAIMAIVAMAIYLLVKFCQSQGPSDAFSATVNFTEYCARVEHPDRLKLNSRNAQVEQWRRRG